MTATPNERNPRADAIPGAATPQSAKYDALAAQLRACAALATRIATEHPVPTCYNAGRAAGLRNTLDRQASEWADRAATARLTEARGEQS